MSYQLTVVYNQPEDPAAFDAHYEQTHSALATKIPDLQAYASTKPDTPPDGSTPSAYLVAMLAVRRPRHHGSQPLHRCTDRRCSRTWPTSPPVGSTIMAGEVTTYV